MNLTIAELNELIYRIGTSIKNNTTQEVFYMTKEQAEDLRDRLTTKLEERNMEDNKEL